VRRKSEKQPKEVEEDLEGIGYFKEPKLVEELWSENK
jgi:hypothetical protein